MRYVWEEIAEPSVKAINGAQPGNEATVSLNLGVRGGICDHSVNLYAIA
jgi:hypothetical protein